MSEFGVRSSGGSRVKKQKEKEEMTEEKDETTPGGRDHDHFLPIANVSRIMKKALPTNAKISKDSKDTVQECVSEFISFITGEASDKCLREKRKTVNGDDLLWAITTLGFEDYVEPLRVYLMRYRETEDYNRPLPVEVAARDGYAPQDAADVVERGRLGFRHVYGSDGFHGMAL